MEQKTCAALKVNTSEAAACTVHGELRASSETTETDIRVQGACIYIEYMLAERGRA